MHLASFGGRGSLFHPLPVRDNAAALERSLLRSNRIQKRGDCVLIDRGARPIPSFLLRCCKIFLYLVNSTSEYTRSLIILNRLTKSSKKGQSRHEPRRFTFPNLPRRNHHNGSILPLPKSLTITRKEKGKSLSRMQVPEKSNPPPPAPR